jgi:hypothetical protein
LDNLDSVLKLWEKELPLESNPRYQEIKKLEDSQLSLSDRQRSLNQRYLNEIEACIKYELSSLSPEQLVAFSVLNKQETDSLKKYFLDKKDDKITKAYPEILNHIDFIDPKDLPALFQRLSVHRLARTYPISGEIISSNTSNLISDRVLGMQSGTISNRYAFYSKMSYNNYTLQSEQNGAIKPKLSGYTASFGFDRDIGDSNFLLGLLYSYSNHYVEYEAYKAISGNVTDIINSNLLYAYFSMPFSSDVSFSGKVGGGISNLSLESDRATQKGWIFDTKGSVKYTKNFGNFLIDFFVPECSFLSYSYKKGAGDVMPGVEGLALTDNTKGNCFSISTGIDISYFVTTFAPKIIAKVKYSKYLPDTTHPLSKIIDLSGVSVDIGGGAIIKAPHGILDIVGSYGFAKHGMRGFSCSLTAKVEL